MQSPSSLGMRSAPSRIVQSSTSVHALGSTVCFRTIDQFGRHSRKSAVDCRAGAKAGNLPWQVAMSEIKKRRDIKSIMSKSREQSRCHVFLHD